VELTTMRIVNTVVEMVAARIANMAIMKDVLDAAGMANALSVEAQGMSQLRREHKLCCNEMHQHIALKCCSPECWCIIERVEQIIFEHNRSCARCKFFIQSGTLILRKIAHGSITNKNVSAGKCRRHAPVMRSWPSVTGDDWCGDFELDTFTMETS